MKNANSHEVRIKTLREHLDKLLEEYQAAYKQLGFVLSDVDRLKIKRQIASINQELSEREKELEHLLTEQEGTNSSKLLREYLGHTYHINALSINEKGSLLATGSGDLKSIVWQVNTGEIKAFLKHNRWIGAVHFVSDQLLATTDGSGKLRLWDWENQQVIEQVQAHQGACRALAVSPDGTTIITGGEDQEIKFWSSSNLGKIRTLEGHRGQIRRLAISSDGKCIVSVDDEGMICLWELVKDMPKHILDEQNTVWRSVALSADNKYFAATNAIGVVILWNIADELAQWRVQAHQGASIGISFHPDGNILATSGQDKLIRLWHIQSGELLETLSGHQDTVTALLFTNKGRLFSSSRDCTVRLWRNTV